MKFEMNGTTVMHVMLEKTKKKGETKRISIRQIYAVLLYFACYRYLFESSIFID